MPTFWVRTDSNSANNPAMNLTTDDAFEISFVPSGSSGDVLLEYDSGNVDPDTQVQIDGVNYDFVFELSATLPTENSDGAQQVPEQFEGASLFLITIQDYPTAGETTRVAFLPEEDATMADMDAFGNGAIELQNIDTTTPGVVCFAAGTRLMTPDGERPVEELREGDLVSTAGGAALPIVWISSSTHVWPGATEEALPILISQGALGAGRPARDLIVSPQHKVLISGAAAERHAGVSEVLVPAKGLTRLSGIRRMKGKRRVTYYHVLLQRHAILLSERLASESFYPGPMALRMLRIDQRLDIHRKLPGLRDNGYGPTARQCLTRRQTQALARAISAKLTPASRV